MNEADYLLSARKAVPRDDDDEADRRERWIGVRNRLGTRSVDDYFRKVG